MTSEKWKKLTYEERCIEVATLHGDAQLARDTKDGPLYYTGPDYLNDLNAMHAVFVALTIPQRIKFNDMLVKLCEGNELTAINAPAARRAEALVLVMEPE